MTDVEPMGHARCDYPSDSVRGCGLVEGGLEERIGCARGRFGLDMLSKGCGSRRRGLVRVVGFDSRCHVLGLSCTRPTTGSGWRP